MAYHDVLDTLSQLISKKRFDHSCRVADTAKQLAICYHVDPEKAYLAGLIHDAAKDLTPSSSPVSFTKDDQDFFIQYPAIWHAFVIEPVACHFFGISDSTIISAAKWHSTGTSNMSLLEKILYVSDYIEPGRSFLNRSLLYDQAFSSLDKTVFDIASFTLSFLLEHHQPIYPASLNCYNYYL